MQVQRTRNTVLIVALPLLVVFFLLHYFVYLQNYPSTLPVLQSYTDPPLTVMQLHLCAEKYPNYLNPFQKVKYSYQTYSFTDQSYGDCNLTETAQSVFTSKMVAADWSPEDYWAGFDIESFMRNAGGVNYANLIFFFLQYTIIATWIFIIIKSVKRNK